MIFPRVKITRAGKHAAGRLDQPELQRVQKEDPESRAANMPKGGARPPRTSLTNHRLGGGTHPDRKSGLAHPPRKHQRCTTWQKGTSPPHRSIRIFGTVDCVGTGDSRLFNWGFWIISCAQKIQMDLLTPCSGERKYASEQKVAAYLRPLILAENANNDRISTHPVRRFKGETTKH